MSDWHALITVEVDQLGGKPRVRGMRIPVADVLEYLASGMMLKQGLSARACGPQSRRRFDRIRESLADDPSQVVEIL